MAKELQERLYTVLKRNQRKSEYYEQKYHGKEEQHTFHGGWNLGYWEGRVTAFEECLDLLEELGIVERFEIADYLKMNKED